MKTYPEHQAPAITVLLVDDEEMIRTIGMQMLERLGYNALTAGSGPAAIEIFKQNPAAVQVVVLDMVMPGMNGGETYARLKQIRENVKVILSTGYTRDGQAEDILSKGCDGFIQKPFRLEELDRAIQTLLLSSSAN
jgi:CheY-like chemotaxis protein